MLSRFTLRGGWLDRSMRSARCGMVWVALLALALPGFASLRGLCCEPGLTKGSDCCAASMKMPGMDSSQMESMMGAAVVESSHRVFAAVAECAMAPVGEAPEFVVRNEGAFERDLASAQGQLAALTGTRHAELSAASTMPSFFVYKTPPGLFLSDPLFVVLRV